MNWNYDLFLIEVKYNKIRTALNANKTLGKEWFNGAINKSVAESCVIKFCVQLNEALKSGQLKGHKNFKIKTYWLLV